MNIRSAGRRDFIRFLMGSPLLAGVAPPLIRQLWAADELPEQFITSPAEALNVFDFHTVAKRVLSPAHYGYLASGSDGGETLRANRRDFAHYRIRARRLVDVTALDTSIELFGQRWNSPVGLCPVSSQQAFHPEGELASARAARDFIHIFSTMSSTGYEDAGRARGTPLWYQLYPSNNWNLARSLTDRVERAGCPVLVVTVDRLAPRSNLEKSERLRRQDDSDCRACHVDGDRISFKPMMANLDPEDLRGFGASALTWDFIDRLKNHTSMKLVLKGIVTREDAVLCVRAGVDGIIVSNHGGRAEASGRSTITSLTEVVTAVNGAIPVLIDSGFRRGTDIFKALALGASAVLIGRPYIWGLSSFGEAGVKSIVRILDTELKRVMMESGFPVLADIDKTAVERSDLL